ncbi:8793_t:CDS:2 [Funneliformis caledonium]|uniref:glutaminase n=2 Tax=Funneliformis TaxID=1117308 RepID=A0A9N9G163_9GLOM|nr:199_t:CDS:2 [Funneliformis mosseae]CAG8570248.1 8793_t:CDS:2 [Funneliformis caledonium]
MVHINNEDVNNNEVNRSRRFHFGILALQGAFQEHIHMLQNIPQVSSAIPIRKVEQLATIDALIIPGGESTTMALIAERSGLMEPLREFVRSGKPTWGTCAGMILLANEANKTKKGGQSLIGGLDITVNRNQFGSQIDSFESALRIENVTTSSDHLFPAVFIRAPIISSINSPDIEVLARLEHNVGETDTSAIVAVKQDNLLATAFHPELTNDDRLHKYFVQLTQDYYYTGKKEK